jgi:hypothetical protein
MTKNFILAVIVTFGTLNSVSARVKIPVCFPCENLETIKELPTDSEIQKIAGQKVNLSYINVEYGMLWLSAWNSDGRYVLSDISNNTYFEIDEDVAKILKEKHHFDISTAERPLSFMKKIGGKLVFLLIIGLLFWGNRGSKKDDEVKPTTI